MAISIYKKLQQDFITVRSLFSESCRDEAFLEATLSDIREIRAKIAKKKDSKEKKLLLYCIDTLFEIIDENNSRKIYDFADTIHNMPEICLEMRNVYSFAEEMDGFRKIYGKKYFPDYKKVKPKFQKKAPKNKWEYFSAESDLSFKYLHPVGYTVLCLVGVMVLILPMFIYVAYTLFINPAPSEWTLVLGQAGTFIIGVGLFNIVAAWIHQYMGHLVTVGCILGGALLTALSLYLLYS